MITDGIAVGSHTAIVSRRSTVLLACRCPGAVPSRVDRMTYLFAVCPRERINLKFYI